ncbi:MAG: glycosyltransferase family 2 protein [Neisseria sp.]|nr:glycosyltransferase family 2 protein [Neisseria sp.]
MNAQKLDLSVIIPVYNDAAALALFLPQLFTRLQHFAGEHELVVVDDGSKDDLETVFREHTARLPENCRARLVRFSRNFGKEAALSAGLAQAQGEAVVMMDADGQHPVELLAKMRELILSGNDMVAAVQSSRELESWGKRAGKRWFYRLIQDSDRFEITPGAGDFRMMSRRVVDALNRLPERKRFMKGLYAWVGFPTVYLPFAAEERLAGASKFGYRQLFGLALTGFTAFSTRPLRWVSHIGLLVSLFALIYAAYVVIETLFLGKHLPGWPTLAAGMMLFSGVQLICLGVIGEYIGNIYTEVKQRPPYIIDSIEHSDEAA